MTSQLRKYIITRQIFPNFSRNKGYKTMNFGQLLEDYMRNISLEKSYWKYGKETIPRSFSKKSKLCISMDQ